MFALISSALTLSLCAVGLMANTRLIQSPGALVLREGETVEIRCVLNSSNEGNIVNKFDVHWFNSPHHSEIKLTYYVDGRIYRSAGFSERFQLSRDVASNSYSLTIREVVISDSADYICGIWGTIFGNGTQLNVTIANPPILIQLPRLERVTEGHTARLRCSMVNAEVGSTDVHWYRELPGQDMEWVLTHEAGGNVRRRPGFTERFQPFRDASNSSFTLTVTNVTLNDSAAYYCTVWGDIRGNGTQLNVTSPLNDPVLIQSPSVSKVSEGVTVQLQCALYNAIVNDTDVHWNQQRPGNKSEWVMSHFVDGNVTRSGCISDRFKSFRNAMRNSYILTIANVSINDTAVYSCSVWSYIYGAGSQLNVSDANPPILIQFPRLERVTEDDTAQLRCSMENAEVGKTDVHWYRELPGRDMEWVLTHEAGGSVRRRPGFTERFQPFKDPSNSSFTLTVTNVMLNDSALYYCTVWGDIKGNGTQIIVIKPYEKLSLKILGSIVAGVLVFILLFSILAIAVCYLKKWVCFQYIFKPEGSSTEDLNTVHSTVTVETKTNTKPATNVTMSAESEVFYADIQFARRNTKAPTIEVSEETTEYAAIKRA